MVKEAYVILDYKNGDGYAAVLDTENEEFAKAVFRAEWGHLSKNDQKNRQAFILVKAMVEDGEVDYETVKMVERVK